MSSHDLYLFRKNIKENIPDEERKKGGISIEPINFDLIKFSIDGDGIIDLKSVIEIQDYLELSLKRRSYILDFIAQYHPDSPRYWRPVGTVEREENDVIFELSIDIEDFISSKDRNKYEEMDFYIPDNYELSKILEKEFEESLGSMSGIEGNHYRELSVWESKDKESLEKLGSFIEEKYVAPKLKEIMSEMEIREVKFENGKVDFIYEN
jgi:hypothetical protein